ncbi:hypothetical protein [Streptomyces sp. NPDC047976]|uniref:hypothetical protein n=1 Tax=unclassified Streptomyces TaxID=2593676 RepID=UPI00341C42AE
MTRALPGQDPPRLPGAGRERLLASARHRHRRSAEAGLRAGTAESGPVHERLLHDPDPEVREDVASGLRTLGGAPRTPAVTAALAALRDGTAPPDG